jgi:hypothetical protein
LGFDGALRDRLPTQAGYYAIQQSLAHPDKGVSLADAHVGRVVLADASAAERLLYVTRLHTVVPSDIDERFIDRALPGSLSAFRRLGWETILP